MEFVGVGTADEDTFCLLGAADGVLLSDFLFPLRASLALSRRRLPWCAFGTRSGAEFPSLGLRGAIVESLGRMAPVFSALAEDVCDGLRVNLSLSRPSVMLAVPDGTVAVAALAGNEALAGKEAACNCVNDTS
jgi:hypothetical protein